MNTHIVESIPGYHTIVGLVDPDAAKKLTSVGGLWCRHVDICYRLGACWIHIFSLGEFDTSQRWSR